VGGVKVKKSRNPDATGKEEETAQGAGKLLCDGGVGGGSCRQVWGGPPRGMSFITGGRNTAAINA